MGRWRERLFKGRRKWLVIGLIAMPVVGVASIEITSTNRFCNTCHIMEPYYTSWKVGSHKDVDCVKCHISPGVDNFLAAKFNGLGQVVDDVLHRTSNKPSASVSELACTRSGCHSMEKVRETSKTDGKFKFRHDKHLDGGYAGVELACTTCHAHIKGSEHFELNTDACVTCHLVQRDPHQTALGNGLPQTMIRMAVRESKGAGPAPDATAEAAAAAAAPAHGPLGAIPSASCSACHNPPQGVLERRGLKIDHSQYLAYGASCESCHRGTTATPEPITDAACLDCHTFGVEKALPAAEMHKVHLEGRHKIECLSCHGTTRHGPMAQAASLEQFDCRRCHQDQHNVQRNAYLVESAAHTAPGSPAVSPMFLAHVDCTACHIKERPLAAKPGSGATVSAAVPEACDKCHKPGLGEMMIPLWQKTTRGLYAQLESDLAAAEAAGAGKDLVEQTRRLLEMVRVDGSWGVHNPRYTQQLLEEARAKVAAGKEGAP